MKETEAEILLLLNLRPEIEKKYLWDKWHEINDKIKEKFSLLQEVPIGLVSLDFLNNPLVFRYIKDICGVDSELYTWHFIQTANLEEIEKLLQANTIEYKKQLEKYGYGLPPVSIYSKQLIKSVYLSEKSNLIDIFQKYLPIPNPEVFTGFKLPTIIEQRQKNSADVIKKLIKNEGSLELLTQKIIKIQQIWRAKNRRAEEIIRIAKFQRMYEKDFKNAEQFFHDANTPYRPKCEEQELVRRIMQLAQKIQLYQTVRHLTAANAIENIFNDALYGRRNLIKNFISFRPASLINSDVQNGDGNVVCLGTAKIDPTAMQKNTIELIFDIKKLSCENKNVFFKQKDFCYSSSMDAPVAINKNGSKKIYCFWREGKNNASFLNISFSNAWCEEYAAISNFRLISYNSKNINQIWILNFFRFLDAAITTNPNLKDIYNELATLNDDELVRFLTQIGRLVSMFNEFNFYGAYQIDFSALRAIGIYHDENVLTYSFDLEDLIISLNANDLSKLKKAQNYIPGILKSYRFLDYLLTKVNSEVGRAELQLLRAGCKLPLWLDEKEWSTDRSNVSGLS